MHAHHLLPGLLCASLIRSCFSLVAILQDTAMSNTLIILTINKPFNAEVALYVNSGLPLNETHWDSGESRQHGHVVTESLSPATHSSSWMYCQLLINEIGDGLW